VFKRALAVEPRDRFPHAGEFMYALDRAISCEGRVTSTQISRVSGVLEYQPSEDTVRRHRHAHALRSAAAARGDTVVAPKPAQSGGTVLAPIPDFETRS
jgi:hypothetical protein